MFFRLSALFAFVLLIRPAYPQAGAAAAQQDDKAKECRSLDSDIFPAGACSVMLSYLGPGDSLGPAFSDGTFIVLSPLPDGKSDWKEYHLPPKLRSAVAFSALRQTIAYAELGARNNPKSAFAAMLPDGRDLWLRMREVYCYYHPDNSYADLAGKTQQCFVVSSLPDSKALADMYGEVLTFKNNYETFQLAHVAERLSNSK